MHQFLLFFLMVPVLLFSYVDSDMDGVEDKDDICPNTLMTDLVDLKGCTIKSLLSPHHFVVMAGTSYAQDSDSSYIFSTLELDYYFKKFSLQLSSSYYDLSTDISNNEGLNDSSINLFYRFNPLENFSLKVGAGLLIPTYDSVDNKTDYTTSLYGRYYFDKWSLSTGLGYKFVGDTNASNVVFYNVSVAHNWSSKFYSSLGYYVSESIYEDVDNFESLSLYNYYSMDKNWFGTLTLTQGISSESLDNSLGVKLGYYW